MLSDKRQKSLDDDEGMGTPFRVELHKNKLLLIEAEMHYTLGEFDKAATKYEASIKAAQEHKFIHEQAIASERAGFFFLEGGMRQKSHSHFKHASECYEKWGATVLARRVDHRLRDEFGLQCMMSTPDLSQPIVAAKDAPTNKRPLAFTTNPLGAHSNLSDTQCK